MSKKLGMEPAFPSDHEWSEGGKDGLGAPVIVHRKSFGISKRLYIATALLQARLSRSYPILKSETVKEAYAYADEMLKQENL